MAKKPSQPQDNTQDSDRQFIIKQVFIKKTALDVTLAPFELTAQWQPDASMQIDVHTEKLADDDYIVELKTNIDVKNDSKQIFTIESVQSGIFQITGYTEEQMDQLRNSFCPNVLFPYARQIVSQLTSQAGFPPLIMAPIDFDGRYQQMKAEGKSA